MALIINYPKKAKFMEVFHEMIEEGFSHKHIPLEPNGEVEAKEYAKTIGSNYVYFCLELEEYYIFYRE